MTDPAPGSALDGLRQRIATARDELHLRLRVPRLEPAVYVRYGPVSSERMAKARQRSAQSEDGVVAANAAMLADSCQAIFEVNDSREVSLHPDGDVLVFDPRLRDLLGLDEDTEDTKDTKAGDLVRKLYLTDGDVSSAADQLVDWSGYMARHQEIELSGN